MSARTDADGHYDAVVVGSGFGGSVTTYRLAEAGRRVLLLERGRPFPPGSFPRSPYRMRRAFWDPSEGLYGMFSIWSFDHLGAVVSSGLGGGSLIYANVLLRKDERWFVREEGSGEGVEYWPITRADLEPHYDRVEAMLAPQRYPFEAEPYASTPRTVLFTRAARDSGWEPFFPPLGVTFAAPGRPPRVGDVIPDPPGRPNLHGSVRTTCRLVGECDIGCNFGAKNTLDYNYLSEALHEGAEIRTLCEVRELEPRAGGGWIVRYVEHDLEREGEPFATAQLPLRDVTCDRLVLSAGTLGTVYLLLRNRHRLPGLSQALGSRFSGNGDLLTLAMKPRDPVTGRLIAMESGLGPAITAAIRFADSADGAGASPDARGFYLEDAGYPDMINWLIQAVEQPGVILRYWFTALRLVRRLMRLQHDTDVGAEMAQLLGNAELSSGIVPLLGMGREVPNGVMALRDGLLDVEWTIDRSSRYFERVRDAQRQLARAMNAEFRDNPLWHFGRRVITVHPLGGAPMGRDEREGVVDSWGRAFGHDDLYIADGSVMPGTIGPNPSLTIAAFADRVADGILA